MTPTEEAQVARGARLRALNRLIVQADKRAARRFRRWMGKANVGGEVTPEYRSERRSLWTLYIEAEDLHSDLMRSRNGRVQG